MLALELADFPKLNASLNALCTVFLVAGYAAIKARPARVAVHRACMGAAFLVSTVFLGCYLYYHFHHPTTRFTTPGWPKVVYFLILVPHVILATVQVPLILVTLYHALRKQWDEHRRFARITFPIWAYVSVTGVLVYMMLYEWFPPTP